jgi:uncharacterized protein (DUF924 family)
MSAAADIVAFWREAGRRRGFGGGAQFDRACDERFRAALFAAAAPSSMIGDDGEIAQLGWDRS